MRYRVLLAAVLLGLVACRSDRISAPRGDVAGLYVLQSVNGQILPAPGNGPYMTAYLIVADTIRLRDDGTGDEVRVIQYPGESQPQVSTMALSVTTRPNGVLDFAYECNDVVILASCIAPPHFSGVRTETGLRVVSSSMYRTPMEFVPVGPLMWK